MMDTVLIIVLVFAIIFLLFLVIFRRRKKPVTVEPFPAAYRQLLLQEVLFYEQLEDTKKKEFEHRMQDFLARVRISGVNTTVEDLDKVLVAASAIIPIFGFPDWQYINLREVLLYPDSFNMDFEQAGADRSTLGMVGTGAMQNVMILSRHELRQGFLNRTGKNNTAIHEFVHLVDKTDGSVDGVPELLLSRRYVLPWLELMQQEIKNILKNRSDINPYGATNQGEFLAVAAEYFFERPDLLQDKHPELYVLLTKIFRQVPIPG
jgi:hypothetical protein